MSYLVRPPVLCPHAAALHLLSPPGRWPGLGHGPQGAVRHVVGPLALVRVAVGVPKLRAARNTVTHHRHAPHSRTPVTKPSHAPQSRAPVTHPCPQSRAPVTRPSHAPQSRTRHVPDRIRACPPGPTRRRRPARRPTGTCPPNPHPPTPQNNNPTSLPPRKQTLHKPPFPRACRHVCGVREDAPATGGAPWAAPPRIPREATHAT